MARLGVGSSGGVLVCCIQPPMRVHQTWCFGGRFVDIGPCQLALLAGVQREEQQTLYVFGLR